MAFFIRIGTFFHFLILATHLRTLTFAAPSGKTSYLQTIQSAADRDSSLLRKLHSGDSTGEEHKRATLKGFHQFPILHQTPQNRIIKDIPILHGFLGKRTDGVLLQRVKGGVPNHLATEQTTKALYKAAPFLNQKRGYQAAFSYPLLHLLSGRMHYPLRKNRFPILHSVPASSLHFKRSDSKMNKFLQSFAASNRQPKSSVRTIDFKDFLNHLNEGDLDARLFTEFSKMTRRSYSPNTPADDEWRENADAAISRLLGSKTGFNSKKKAHGPVSLSEGIFYIFGHAMDSFPAQDQLDSIAQEKMAANFNVIEEIGSHRGQNIGVGMGAGILERNPLSFPLPFRQNGGGMDAVTL